MVERLRRSVEPLLTLVQQGGHHGTGELHELAHAGEGGARAHHGAGSSSSLPCLKPALPFLASAHRH
jgi:hypothetical protein